MIQLIDHLILFSPTLEEGMDYVEKRLGVRPMMGGRHPNLGTHNALLCIGGVLGADCYLEVMAPDPSNPNPADPADLGLGPLEEPRLLTWVLRAEDIEERAAAAEGIGLGEVVEGHRDNPDGSRVSWRITEPFAFPLQGTVPFLIAWGDSPHPSSVAPKGGILVGLTIEHPDPEAVRSALARLGVDIPVWAAEQPSLKARIQTPEGIVELG